MEIFLQMSSFMLKNNTLDVSNVGRLGVLLAQHTFFGDEVLQESTLKGKGKRPGLDPSIFDSLVSTIHNRHPFSAMSLEEFRRKIRPKIERSLTDFLKPKSKKVKRSGLFLYVDYLGKFTPTLFTLYVYIVGGYPQ